jgi:alkylhydroperoxidase/carboxymuconolactone decarboxylase family protein YurZ
MRKAIENMAQDLVEVTNAALDCLGSIQFARQEIDPSSLHLLVILVILCLWAWLN